MAPRGQYRKRVGKSYAALELTGPFFEADPSSTMGKNIQRMLQGLADEGAKAARSEFAGHRRSGDFERGIVGRVGSLKGAPWWKTAVVSQTHVEPWAVRGSRSFGVQQSGVRKRSGVAWSLSDSDVMNRMANANYRGGKLEAKVHGFRTAANRLKSSRAAAVANLTKGIE